MPDFIEINGDVPEMKYKYGRTSREQGHPFPPIVRSLYAHVANNA
jgi:hypothetical protein